MILILNYCRESNNFFFLELFNSAPAAVIHWSDPYNKVQRFTRKKKKTDLVYCGKNRIVSGRFIQVFENINGHLAT